MKTIKEKRANLPSPYTSGMYIYVYKHFIIKVYKVTLIDFPWQKHFPTYPCVYGTPLIVYMAYKSKLHRSVYEKSENKNINDFFNIHLERYLKEANKQTKDTKRHC